MSIQISLIGHHCRACSVVLGFFYPWKYSFISKLTSLDGRKWLLISTLKLNIPCNSPLPHPQVLLTTPFLYYGHIMIMSKPLKEARVDTRWCSFSSFFLEFFSIRSLLLFRWRSRLKGTSSEESLMEWSWSYNIPGGGGHFRNFWVAMCRWEPGTLNLYQS